MNECTLCGLKTGERVVRSPIAPTLCWLEISRASNGYIQMKFGYGDDDVHDVLYYQPKYCPECGKKITKESV